MLIAELELKEHVRAVQEFRRALEQTFGRSLRLRARTPLMRRLEPLMQAEFQAFREGMLKVERFLRKKEAPDLRRGCGKARSALEQIQALARELQDEERSFQQFSEAPSIQELAALITAVEGNQLSPEVLSGRVSHYRATYKRLEEDLSEARRAAGQEPADPEGLLPAMLGAVRALRAQMAEIETAVRKSVWELPSLRDKLVARGEDLLALHKRWMERLAPEVVCPRCQVPNPAGSKVCQGCQAALPQVDAGPASTFSLEAAPTGGGRQRLAYIQQVEAAVESLQAGETDLAHFAGTVRWFAGRVRQGRQNLAAVQPPARFESPEAEEKARQVRALLESASGALLAGVEALERYLTSQDPDELSTSLDHLLGGEAQMLEAQQTMRS